MAQTVILGDETARLMYHAKSILMKRSQKNISNESVIYSVLTAFIINNVDDLEEMIKCPPKKKTITKKE